MNTKIYKHKPPMTGNGLFNLFTVKLGMAYCCFTNIKTSTLLTWWVMEVPSDECFWLSCNFGGKKMCWWIWPSNTWFNLSNTRDKNSSGSLVCQADNPARKFAETAYQTFKGGMMARSDFMIEIATIEIANVNPFCPYWTWGFLWMFVYQRVYGASV